MKLIKTPCNLPGIGVFGCNKFSEFLVNCLIKNGFRITAVWSDRLEQARAFAQRFKIDFYTDKMDVLLLKKEVELILINCDQSLYVQIVSKAFRIGKHVFCNWPSSLTVRELSEMYDAASYYPSLISIYSFPLRFLPQFKLMRSLILEQNYIGEINLVNVTINGRSLIELDTVEQLFNQSNCAHCRKIEAAAAEQRNGDQQPNDDRQLNDDQQPSSITDESSIEDQFVDPNKVELLNAKNKQTSNSHNHPKLNTHPDTTANHPNNHPNNQHSTGHRPRNKTDLPVNSNLLASLKKKLEVNSSANQKYKELMQSNGLLQSVGPHVIDVITFITNLKAKKCNGILRTFNLSPFSNELSLIKRINVDDFCAFQMQMDKIPQSTGTNKSPAKVADRTNGNDRNKPATEQANNKNSQSKFNYKKQAKQLSNNEPIAIVNLNDHLDSLDKGYEMIVAGEFGYLRLKNGNLFGRQYEQNNNDGSGNLDSLEEEKAFYLMKDHLKLDNYCLLHQNQELSKIILQNKQPIKPFELGLEKLVESIKAAFDNEMNSTGGKTNSTESEKKQLVTDGDKKRSDSTVVDKQTSKDIDGQPNSLKENQVKTSNQTNGYHSTIVQVNNERNLATAPLKEKQTNASDLIIQPTQVISNGSESKPIKFNGTSTTISVNAPPKVQQNGVNRPASEPVTNGNTNGTTNNNSKPPTNCVSNGVAKRETTKSTVKTQQSGSSSSNESSLSSIDSNETAVIGEVDRAPSSQSRTSNEDGEKCCNRWFKEAVLLASNFEDGRYVLSVIEAIRSSSRLCEWTRVQNHLPRKQ